MLEEKDRIIEELTQRNKVMDQEIKELKLREEEMKLKKV